MLWLEMMNYRINWQGPPDASTRVLGVVRGQVVMEGHVYT